MTTFIIFATPVFLMGILFLLVKGEQLLSNFDADSLEEWEAFGDAIEGKK